ncbi:A-kinase anchor protein SPHKAP isoform X3 [Astyanax mexicanus]|uniref:A-kinase anchor protein SPHKAP isoform X3 n=1 Tax=Astyanax mexicanus TaxID=7994 RepID=UPI0020CAE937|nr:A-kinase anchor protein SPHKAP isoform X3 [Astyanax mexicanus]
MAGARRAQHAARNFQCSAMFEGDSLETEGVKTESSLASSISACKKVLCSNSVLDSSEYWLKNDKALCRVGFLEDQHEGGCTICFVSLDASDRNDSSCLKKLASVSPDLPRLVECVGMRPLKEQEILLLTGLESPDTCQHDPAHTQSQRTADVCMVQSSGARHPTPNNIILQINKFLIGLQSGQEKQRHNRLAGQRITDDDTNRSVSSIEEDFLTASEQLGEDSEDDPFRNDADGGVSTEAVGLLRSGNVQIKSMMDREDSEDSDTLCSSSKSHKLSRACSAPIRGSSAAKHISRRTKESAGHYATNLAESVLQDAFIHLSQDEPSFVPEAAVSISSSPHKATCVSRHMDEPARARTRSFELPKIVIVQSPDNCDEAAEWPGMQPEHQGVNKSTVEPVAQSHTHHSHGSPKRHSAKPVEVALACAASVIGTISTPQVTERLTLESGEEDEVDEEEESETEQADYSFSSAVCGMAQVAGAVAVVDLAEDSGDNEDSGELFSASMGLLSAAQASTAIPLHCSVAEGTCVETFRANVAEVLLREASAVLTHKQSYTSIANFLETTHNKIVDGITRPRRSYQEHLEADDFTQEVVDSVFKYALEKAGKRKDLEEKDVLSMQHFLMESVNSLLFDVLCVTSRKISDISKCNPGSADRRGSEACSKEYEAATKPEKEALSQLQCLNSVESSHPDNPSKMQSCSLPPKREREQRSNQEERESELNLNGKEPYRLAQSRINTATVREPAGLQSQLGKCDWSYDSRLPSTESSPLHSTRGKAGREGEIRQQSYSSSTGALSVPRMEQGECKTPVTCFAEDLATTVVSMATELAAICLENSSGKQPWFCALKGASEGPEGLLLPCRTAAALRRKETQNGAAVAKKHRPPRLSEIKRKTEEQPELMERLVNRVVDETVSVDDPTSSDPFALFASEVTARIMNCPELNVVDTSKQGQPSRSRLQCERWSSRGKASSYESIPEEDADPSGAPNTLGLGNRLGHNLSRGSSISKQSSCESITDEFSRFMVNQMETEGREFDLLLDYYAGKNASSILAAAVQQAASRKNGHLNVRTTTCLSKQSSTESITEEFYRFMLKDMDKENKDYGISKTKEWSKSLLTPTPRSPFCIRQSSVPDRRSSDSRLTVNSPIKANSFDGFARNVHADFLNTYPSNSVSSTSLCKSDSCLYQRGQTDHITDMLIHETWSSSIESLMRKNKIITEPSEDSMELDSTDSQPHVQLFANRLAADIVESGKSLLGGPQEGGTSCHLKRATVGERRQGFRQSRPGSGHSRASTEQQDSGEGPHGFTCGGPTRLAQREVPLIHIEPDQRDEARESTEGERGYGRESHSQVQPQSSREKEGANWKSSDSRTPTVPSTVAEGECRSLSTSSEESGSGSWAQVAPEEDPQEETTSSFIQLSEGNGNSSASSLGVADLEGFPECSVSAGLISEERERKAAQSQEQADEVTSGLSTAGSSCQRELLVVNVDVGVDSEDVELRAALQWIAASELGVPALYFRKTQEHSLAKFQRVVHLAGQKAWRVGDLFSLVAQFCQLQQDQQDAGGVTLGLFDWLLKTQR